MIILVVVAVMTIVVVVTIDLRVAFMGDWVFLADRVVGNEKG